MTYKPHIDGLRAFAVLSVIFFHLSPNNFPGGFIGVDIFFVISGYLITSVLFDIKERSFNSLLFFYIKRVCRIFPSVLLVLLFCMIFGIIFLPQFQLIQLLENILSSTYFFLNIELANNTGYFNNGSLSNLVLHLWSLSVEEQFYLVYPLLFFIFFKRNKIFFFTCILLFIISLYYCINISNFAPSNAFYLLLPRSCEFFLGGLIGIPNVINILRVNLLLSNILSFMSLLALLLFILIFRNTNLYPSYFAIIPAISALILISSPNSIISKKLFASKIAVLIGLLSYSLYLWHWPIIVVSHIYNIDITTPLNLIIFFLSILILATCHYNWFELPIRNYGRKNNYISLIILLLLALVAIITLILPKFITKDNDSLNSLLSDYSYNHVVGYRVRKCLLDGSQHGYNILPECLPQATNNQRSLVIWGDSQAGNLYPGLIKLSNLNDYTISQLTGMGLTPDLFNNKLNTNVPFASENTYYFYNLIKKIKPDILIIGAASGAFDKIQIQNLVKTAESAKAIGISRVIVVGPQPWFSAPVPLLLANRLLIDGITPQYLTPVEIDMIFDVDLYLKNTLTNLNIEYISTPSILCKSRVDCIASFQDTPLFWDAGHLSDLGSIYLGLFIKNQIETKTQPDLNIQILQKYSNSYTLLSDGAAYNRTRLKAKQFAENGAHKNSIRNFEGALLEYNKVISLYPYEPDYFQKRGGINSTLGNFEEAYLDWEKSMQLANNDASIELALSVMIEISRKLQNNALIEKNNNFLNEFKNNKTKN